MQTKFIADYVARFKTLLPSIDQLHFKVDADIEAHLEVAVREYSITRTEKITVAVTGNGTREYFMPDVLGPRFDPKASRVFNVQIRLGTIPPIFLDDDEHLINFEGGSTLGVGGTILTLVNNAPTSTQKFLVTFSALHSVGPGSTTIEYSEFEAVALIHAAYGAEAVAAKLAETFDASLNIDSSDHKNQVMAYIQVARTLRSNANRLLNVSKKKDGGVAVEAASATIEQETKMQSGLDYRHHFRI